MPRGSQEWRQPTRNCAHNQAKGAPTAAVDRDQIISALNVGMLPSSSPTLTRPSTKLRRSTFSLSLPWQPRDCGLDSAVSTSVASECLPIYITSQTSKKRFASLFPELATPSECTSFQRSPSLKTSPLTPPDNPMPPARNSTQTLISTISPKSRTTGSSCSCLIHEYTCALEREKIWPGTLYVTTTHICFHGVHSRMIIRLLVRYKDILSVQCRGHEALRVQIRSAAGTIRSSVDEAQVISDAELKSESEYVLTGFAGRDQVLAAIEGQRMVHEEEAMTVSEPSPYEDSCSAGCDHAVSGTHGTSNALSGFCLGYNKHGTSYTELPPPSASSLMTCSIKARAGKRPLLDLEEVSHWDDITPSSRSGSSISLDSSDPQEQLAATMDSDAQSACSTQRSGRRSENPTLEVMISDTVCGGQHNSQNNPDRISAPIPIQSSTASTFVRGAKLKSPTPPPSLLSPSLTTTKVSRSSSMVRGVAGPGISQESPICLRQGPLSEGIVEEADDKDRSATFSSPPKRVDAATSTSTQAQQRAMINLDDSTTLAPPRASCGCARHYKYPILSTIVPTSLEKCFEALFSARGAGQGDHLVNETLRSVNGSKSIKITPWTKSPAEEGDNNNVWEGKTRTLEHSSILKAQHSHNARTDCRETQRVLEYNLRTIRILSDVWPNLSGGHLISLLSQICLTWDSPGYTRIKCFTEAEYTRAPLWVSAYEADLLEPIDRFYKELIRRLVESIDKQDVPHSWTATTLTISNSPSATGPGNQQGSPSGKASTSSKPSSYSTRTSQPQDAEDASPALSLLSQQLRKNPPAQFKQSRASMESVRPLPESVAQSHATPPSAAPIARRNKAAALIVQAMFPVTISPTKNLSIISEQPTEKTVSRDSVAKTGATTATLWLGLLKKGMAVFKIVTDRTAMTPFAGQVITSGSKTVSRDHASKLTTILDIGSTECSDKPRSEIEDDQAANPRLSSTIAACCSRDQISKSLDEQPSGKRNSGPTPSYTILRVVSVIFAMGMVISAMNVWHLHSAVSSVVDVLQLSHGSISLSDADYASHDQRHGYYEALAPIRMQKELLRAEISELMLMLDSARRSPKPDHGATSI